MKTLSLLAAATLAALAASPAAAQERYGSRPPLVVSPDLAAPWVMQLRRAPVDGQVRGMRGSALRPAPDPVVRRQLRAQQLGRPLRSDPVLRNIIDRAVREERHTATDDGVRTASLAAAPRAAPAPAQLDPKFLPQTVAYDGEHGPGTIVIDTAQKLLYLVESGGQARRYGVGVGKEGFLWKGTEKITRKAEWPDWRPPAEMIAREKLKGRVLPAHMEGGPANPLGARALYLGSTLYRIHGTNAPWTIGTNVSSGCIRMRNEDVMDLYDRVKVGAKVVVL